MNLVYKYFKINNKILIILLILIQVDLNVLAQINDKKSFQGQSKITDLQIKIKNQFKNVSKINSERIFVDEIETFDENGSSTNRFKKVIINRYCLKLSFSNITYNENGSIKYTDDYQYYIPEKHMYNAQKKEICFLKNRYYGNNYHGSSLTLIEIPKWLKSIIK